MEQHTVDHRGAGKTRANRQLRRPTLGTYSINVQVPLTAGYTGDPPPGLGIRGILLGCKPNQEVCGGVESVIRKSRPSGR
jgi:hypothetical protein